MLQTISIVVSGKVQGVYYRQSTKEKALVIGVSGTVKNLKDGNVFIVATGTKEQLEQLSKWCKQGPPGANVVNVIVEDVPLMLFEKFSIVQ